MINDSMNKAIKEADEKRKICTEIEMKEKNAKLDKEIKDEKNSHPRVTDGFDETDDINLLFNDSIARAKEQEENEQKPHEWSKPKPLEEEHKLPPFPLDCLPETVRDYVEAVAESTATPVDMAAVASLAVVASTVQKKYQIKVNTDYSEPLNIYAIIIADPAERKSAVMREMTQYIQEYEQESNRQRRHNIDSQTIEINSKNKMIKRFEEQGEVEKAITEKDECRKLEDQKINELRLIADDVTAESLTTLLSENSGSMSIISAEGGFFDTLAGRYSNTVCIDTVLKAHAGDDIHVDRKGRANEYIKNPALTILLSVQNNVINALFDNDTFNGRGLNARFLYSKPTSKIGGRSFTNPTIPTNLKINYKSLLFSLLDIPENDETKVIKLDDEARELIDDYFKVIEPELIDSLENMRAWAGKLIGATIRIAGILHAMDYEKLINDVSVNRKTMTDAITIANYFLDHSKAVYCLMGVDENMKKVRHILKKLEQNPKPEYKKHDIYLKARNTKIKVTSDINEAIEILIDYEYLHEIPNTEISRAGKKKDIVYKLNPNHFKL